MLVMEMIPVLAVFLIECAFSFLLDKYENIKNIIKNQGN